MLNLRTSCWTILVGSILRRIAKPVGVAAIAAALTGCFNSAEPIAEIYGATMGSTYSVKWVAAANTPKSDDIKRWLDDYLEAFESDASTWRPDSRLSRFNAAPAGTCQIMPQSILDIVAVSQQLHEQTDGSFDITLDPLLQLWGFHGDAGRQQVPDDAQVTETVARTGHQYLHIRDNQLCKDRALELDIGGVAAGYIVDEVVEHFKAVGIQSYMVEITGELKADGNKPGNVPWRIALEEPRDDSRVAQLIFPLRGYGVSTSGDYRNYFEEDGHRYSHTFDPVLGRPIRHDLAAVTVLHRSTAMADGLSTALLVKGEEAGWAYALEHELPALFLIRQGDGFVSRSTPQFIALQQGKE